MVQSTKIFAGVIALTATLALALPSRDGCPDLKASDFEKETLFLTAQFGDHALPNGVAPFYNPKGEVDVLVTLYTGEVIVWEDSTKKPKVLMNLADLGANIHKHEDGVVGVATHKNFTQNGWFYAFYIVSGKNRISRFKYDFTSKSVNKASEAVILDFPVDMNSGNDPKYGHTGGGLSFDLNGNLWIGGGDNYQEGDQLSSEKSSACTGDLRGGILRIKPLDTYADGSKNPGKDVSYSIPQGNFAEHYKSISSDYSNPVKVRPELFAKGTRNAYNVHAHPTRNLVTWGDCGPDFGVEGMPWGDGETEEVNYTHEPGFFGFPYFTAKNLKLNGSGSRDPNNTISAPGTNRCPNGATLPKPKPAVAGYLWRHPKGQTPQIFTCATAANIVSYYKDKESKGGMPPQFHDIFIAGDWGYHWVKWGRFGGAGTDGAFQSFDMNGAAFDGKTFDAPVASTQGPDGLVYFGEHGRGGWWWTTPGSKVSRIRYKGPVITEDCKATVKDPIIFPPVGIQAKFSSLEGLRLTGNKLLVPGTGSFTLVLRTLKGELVSEVQGLASQELSIDTKGHKVLVAQITVGSKSYSQKLFNL